jgi:hypothetical protein
MSSVRPDLIPAAYDVCNHFATEFGVTKRDITAAMYDASRSLDSKPSTFLSSGTSASTASFFLHVFDVNVIGMFCQVLNIIFSEGSLALSAPFVGGSICVDPAPTTYQLEMWSMNIYFCL